MRPPVSWTTPTVSGAATTGLSTPASAAAGWDSGSAVHAERDANKAMARPTRFMAMGSCDDAAPSAQVVEKGGTRCGVRSAAAARRPAEAEVREHGLGLVDVDGANAVRARAAVAD